MTRRLRTAVLAAAVVAFGGAAVAFATSSASDGPTHPWTSTSPLVALGQPIAPPRRVPGTDVWRELRFRAPGWSRSQVVVAGTLAETHGPASRRGTYVCQDVAQRVALARQLRRLGPRRALGECLRPAQLEQAGFTWTMSSGTGAPTSIAGLAAPDTQRLVLTGPGGTYDVPRGRHGSFRIGYAHGVRGRATLTAHLRGGRVVYQRFVLPMPTQPTQLFRGALARDPEGRPGWAAQAYLIGRGPLAGRTCVYVQQDTDGRTHSRVRMGGWMGRDVCGDLRAHPLVAAAVRANDPRTVPPGVGLRVARRRMAERDATLIVSGAVSRAVRSVAIVGPGGRHAVPLGGRIERAFVAVYPAGTRPAQVTIEATLVSGRTLHYPGRRLIQARLRPRSTS